MNKKITLFLMCALCALVGNAAGSGIFVRGGLNNWGAEPAWEFQTTEKEGVYTLADKELFGQFKVADANWSDACNYGGISGAVPQLGMSYSLVPGGASANIDLGDATYTCKTITLTIDGEGNASLLLEGTEGEAGEVTEVYVMGNNNGWDFTDPSGKLSATETAGEFSGVITFPAAEESELSYWRIFEGLGGKGTWGFAEETTVSTLEGTFTKGLEKCCTTAPGTYKVTFNINTGAFKLVATEGSVAGVDAAGVVIAAANGEIVVDGAQSVAVYTAAGALVSTDARTRVAAGLYIVRADNVVKKVIVK